MAADVELYWQQFVDSRAASGSGPPRLGGSFSFGFTAEDAYEIAEIVLKGTKTATGSLLWSYEADGKTVPHVGDHSVVENGKGEPVCIIETTEVNIIPFDEVQVAYAIDGGEGDRSLASWRQMYWKYIVSECERIDREPNTKAPLVMERFKVVYRELLSAKH